MTDTPPQDSGASASPRLHGDLLTTSLLALLRGWNGYGYQLQQRLRGFGMPVFDPGTVYRTLRKLEDDGLVASFWDTSAGGPARRMYSLTQAGETFLAGWIDMLELHRRFLSGLWGFPLPPVAPNPPPEPASSSRPAAAEPEPNPPPPPAPTARGTRAARDAGAAAQGRPPRRRPRNTPKPPDQTEP